MNPSYPSLSYGAFATPHLSANVAGALAAWCISKLRGIPVASWCRLLNRGRETKIEKDKAKHQRNSYHARKGEKQCEEGDLGKHHPHIILCGIFFFLEPGTVENCAPAIRRREVSSSYH